MIETAVQWLLHGVIPVAGGALAVREVVGNLFGLGSAVLGMRRTVWAWPVGLVGNVLLFTVFVTGELGGHTAGEPLRLIIEGYPHVEGSTMIERREWLREHHDDLRTALMLEPRGHADMYGALLTEPEHPGSDAGVLFMHNEGYSTMCGHGIIAVTKVAIERGLIVAPRAPDGSVRIVLDAPAGPIAAIASIRGDVVTSVRFRNVPSFVLHPAVAVRVGTREVRADVAFGGAFYAIVDSEAAGD